MANHKKDDEIKGKIKVGVSSCLLGEHVRYDGGHKLNHLITGMLSDYFDYVPICPEFEAGFGIPREAMRLTGNPEHPNLVTVRSGKDLTNIMQNWAKRRVDDLALDNLHGFIFKSDSPSSGMERVKVYAPNGMPVKRGIGIFAQVFMQRFPLLPVEDDGRLQDARIRENFIERIFALRRWRIMIASSLSIGNLVEFHTRHKYLFLSHSPELYRCLGNLTAKASSHQIDELFLKYEKMMLEAMKIKTTIKKHLNVLFHIMGFFKKHLSAEEKVELLELFDFYSRGAIPLITPITLLNHYVRKYNQLYLKGQFYLNPHPLELQLRNHV